MNYNKMRVFFKPHRILSFRPVNKQAWERSCYVYKRKSCRRELTRLDDTALYFTSVQRARIFFTLLYTCFVRLILKRKESSVACEQSQCLSLFSEPWLCSLSIQCFRRRRNQISIRAMELRNATDKEVVERVEGSPLSISLTLVTNLRPDRSYSFLASIQLLTICRGKKC